MGAATPAHQIEGGDINNDWWTREHAPNSICAEVSGDACDSYHRYGQTINEPNIVASLSTSASLKRYRRAGRQATGRPSASSRSNRTTFECTAKLSAQLLGRIARANGLVD